MKAKENTEIVNAIINGLPQAKGIMLTAIRLVNLQFEANYAAIVLDQNRYEKLADTKPFLQSLLTSSVITDEQKEVIESLEELRLYFLARKLITKFARQSLRERRTN